MPELTRPQAPDRNVKDGRIAIRASREQRERIAQASEALDTTVSDFVLRASLARAEVVLAERRTFLLSDTQWATFLERLDRPAVRKPRLERLLATPSVLDA